MTNNYTKPIKGTILRISPLQNKIFYLSLSFFAVPVITFFVMSGLFWKHIVTFSVISVIIFSAIVIFCLNERKNIKGAVTVLFILTAAFVSSLLTYTYGYRNAKAVVEYANGSSHHFLSHVVKEDSQISGSLFVEIESIDGIKLDIPVTAQGFNYTGHYLDAGTYLEFDGKLRMSEDAESVYVEWLKSKGVHVNIYSMKNPKLDSDKNVAVVGSGLKRFFRKSMFDVFSIIPEKSRFERAFSISCAMMFGDKSELDEDLKNEFTQSGIIHILCVSGLHFSVLLGGLSVVFRYTLKKRRLRKIFLFACAVIYLLMCGFTRSALRAAVMAFVAGAGMWGKNKKYCTFSLMFAVCVICIADPNAVFDSGFRMSCICCTGILCSSLLSEAVCKRFALNPIICCIISSFIVSLSASAFLFPYCLTSFDGVSIVSVVASTIAVIPAQVFLILCWVSTIVSFLKIEFIGVILSGILASISDYICAVAKFFSGLRYSYIEFETPDLSFLIFMVTLAVAAVVSGSKSRALSFYIYIVSASVLAMSVLLVVKMQ